MRFVKLSHGIAPAAMTLACFRRAKGQFARFGPLASRMRDGARGYGHRSPVFSMRTRPLFASTTCSAR